VTLSEEATFRGTEAQLFSFSPLVTTQMDAATAALRGCRDTQTINITARAKEHGVHMTTLWHRKNGRPSIKDRAPTQQYLTPSEEKLLLSSCFKWLTMALPCE
jgi:hypothetical protein